MALLDLITGMSPDQLMAFWRRYHRAGWRTAAQLTGCQRPGYLKAVWTLATIASYRACAMRCREVGNYKEAEEYSYNEYLMIKRLPKWGRVYT